MRRVLLLLLALLLLPAQAGAYSQEPLVGPARVHEEASLPLPEGAELVAESPRFRFVAFPDAAAPARAVAAEAEGLRNALEENLGQDYPGRTEVRVAMSRSAFQALQPDGQTAPSWAVGLAYPSLNLIVLDASPKGGRQPPRQVLLHEISHLALDRIAPHRFPRWFLEGMAVYHAAEFDPGRTATLATATLRGDWIDLIDLGRGWPEDPLDVQLAYAEAVDFVGWLFREHGQRGIHRLVASVKEGADFDAALEVGTGSPLWKLEKAWHEDLRLRFTWVPLLASGGTLWTLTSLLFLLAYWRKRRQNRAGMRRMELEELLHQGVALSPQQLDELDRIYSGEDGEEGPEGDADEDGPDDPEDEPRKVPYLH
ncbi:MAG: peptidase MA family metallohydrolase [Deltaproteobacteria bacterium]|nr:peptidase MA family metallohydrolase [Deltaproteobacteria bacterium]